MLSQLLVRRGSGGLLLLRSLETRWRPAYHHRHHRSLQARTIFMSDKPQTDESGPRMGRVDRRGVRRRDSDSNSSGGHGNSSPSTVVEKLFKTYTTVDHGQESKNLRLGTGIIARQCDGSAIGMQGGAVVLATVVSSKQPMTGEDFLPLVVEYREKAHAFGRILRNINRREAAQTDQEVLSSRAIDRVIRPLFPDGYYFDTQVVATVESADNVNDLTVLSVNTASAALTVSDVPWKGPVGCVRVGMVDGKLVVNPSEEEMKRSTLDLVYAGNDERTLMIEAGAHQVSDDDMERALKFAHFHCGNVIAAQRQVAAELKPQKRAVPASLLPSAEMWQKAEDIGLQPALAAFTDIVDLSKADQGALQAKVMGDIVARLKEEFPDASPMAPLVCADGIMKKALRSNVLDRETRCDGRALTQLRWLDAAVDVLPRAHGSAVFSRGETQVLCAVTLGSDEDGIMPRYAEEESERKKVFLHYDFPPYSVNETGKVFGANRRMIGHGALAERAVLPVLPPVSQFPYTVRITSEVTSSNGSSSMASACGASLALMDAGVPITGAVAGSSVGLVTEVDDKGNIIRSKLLNDIIGLEDHYGDMDFKVAGTSNGITAIQLDVKLQGGVPLPILCDAIRVASKTRKHILAIMSKAAQEPRPALKPFAPRMEVIHYPFEQHKDLFTLENRRLIEDDYNVTLAFPDDGKVTIFGRDSEKVALAHQHVQELVAEVREGEVYLATVIDVKDFGAVVEVLRGKEGLLHMTEISHKAGNKEVSALLAVGQKIKVKCVAVDRIRGTVKVSRKALLDPSLPDDIKPEPAPGFVPSGLAYIPVPPGTTYTHIDLKKLREGRRRRSGGEEENGGDEDSSEEEKEEEKKGSSDVTGKDSGERIRGRRRRSARRDGEKLGQEREEVEGDEQVEDDEKEERSRASKRGGDGKRASTRSRSRRERRTITKTKSMRGRAKGDKMGDATRRRRRRHGEDQDASSTTSSSSSSSSTTGDAPQAMEESAPSMEAAPAGEPPKKEEQE